MLCLFKVDFLKRNIKRHEKHNWDSLAAEIQLKPQLLPVSHLLSKVKDRPMFCHTTAHWNCKENQISSVSKEKLSHVCVLSGRAVAGKELRQMQAGVVSYSWNTSYRQRGHVGVGKWTWAGVNIDELLGISPTGLTDATTSMSPPSRRDCLPGEDAARNLHYRCVTISDVEVPPG